MYVTLCLTPFCGAAQTKSGPELVLRAGEGPSFAFGSVVFNSDEDLVVIDTGEDALVFDLKWNTELRRFRVSSNQFNRRFKFKHHSKQLLVEDGGTIKACELENGDHCQTLVSDASVESAFALSNNDHWLAYLSNKNVPVLVELDKLNRHITFSGNVPAVGGNVPSLWILAIFSVDDHSLAVARPDGTLTFAIGANPRFQSSFSNPISGTPMSMDFNRSGHLIICFEKEAARSRASSEIATSPAEWIFQTFDLTAGKALSVVVKGQAPQLVRNATAVVYEVGEGIFLDARTFVKELTFADNRDALLRRLPADQLKVHLSPNADRVLYTDATSDSVLVRSLHNEASPIVLRAPVSTAFSIEFLGDKDILIAQGTNTRLWNFFLGTHVGLPEGGNFEFSPDGKVGLFFARVNENTQQLYSLDLSSSKPVPSTLTLSKSRPPDFKVSHDGNRLLWFESPSLVVWDRLKSTRDTLRCKSGEAKGWGAGGLSVMKVSPSGKLVGLLCADFPTIGRPTNRLLIWDIDTLNQVADIDANGFGDAVAFSTDDSEVALGGENIKIVRNSGESFELGERTPQKASDLLATRKKIITSLAFSYGEPSVVATEQGIEESANNDVEVWDLTHRTSVKVDYGGLVGNVAVSSSGFVAVASGDGSIQVAQGLREKPVIRLIGVDTNGWLVVDQNGLFDGNAEAMKWIGWRLNRSAPVLSLDLFFDELYHPGLLAEVGSRRVPSLPPGLDTSVVLRIPGLRTLLRENVIDPKLDREGRLMLCFRDSDAFTAITQAVGTGPDSTFARTADPNCPVGITLPSDVAPDLRLQALAEIKESRVVTPSDGKTVQASPNGTLHILTVAISDYPSAAGLGPTPTAVPAAETLERTFTNRLGSSAKVFSKIKFWSRPELCGRLTNDQASLHAILKCLDAMAADAKPDDIVVLFFAGHGQVPPKQEMFYFLPSDYSPLDDSNQGLSAAMLADKLRQFSARRIVLLIDACQSGAVLDSLTKVAEARARMASAIQEAQRKGGAATPDDSTLGICLISATLPLQLGGGTLVANPFEEALIEGLQGKTSTTDDSVMVSDLVQYIQEHGNKPVANGLSYSPLAVLVGADFAVVGKAH
jgi:hypothetical protein